MTRRIAASLLGTWALTLMALSSGANTSAVPDRSLPAGGPPVRSASVSTAEIARQECPAPFLDECVSAVVAAASASMPAALCISAGDRWFLVTPKRADRVGSSCGANANGTIRILIPTIG